VNQVARFADGVVVGSALVNCIQENLGDTGRITTRLQAVASGLAAGTAR
jgi:tryptophan synthase alpha chain